MKAIKARLSANNLKKLEAGQIAWDTEVKGFGARMAKDGTVTLFLNYSVRGTGKYKRVVICKLPEQTVDAARRTAAEMKLRIRTGADPAQAAETPTARKASNETVRHWVGEWLGDPRHKWSDVTAKAYRRTMNRDVMGTNVADMLMADVKRADLMALVDNVAKRSVSSSVVFFHTLASFLKWADARGLTEATLPRSSTAGEPPAPRTRVMSDAEIATLWHAADNIRPNTAFLGRVVLLTGQRSGAVGKLQPSWISQAGITWPSSVMKSGREHHTALTPWAYEQLRDAPASLAPFALRGGWPKWRKAAGLDDDLRMHDLRRSLRTWAEKQGFPEKASEAALAHTVQKDALARSYQQYDYKDEASEVLRAWQEHVRGLVA